MKPGRARQALGAVVALCCTVAASSCGDNARLIRRATYPPAFRYIANDEIESVMWRLAGRIHELERMSSAADPEVAAMSTLLTRIETEARSLSGGDAGSNHPYLQSRLREFLDVVGRARLDLQRSPPRMASVDDVWRACSGCHARR